MKLFNSFLSIFLIGLGTLATAMDQPKTPSFPVHEAVASLNTGAIIKMNLSRKGELKNSQDKQGNTPYHILKAHEALIPFYAENVTEKEALLNEVKSIDMYLSKARIDKQIANYGKLTPEQLYNFLTTDIQNDTIIPKHAFSTQRMDQLIANGFPKKYITEVAHFHADETDANSITICQTRGAQKMYLKLCKLDSVTSAPLRKPITMLSETRQKKENPIDTLHNFSTICDQYLHWGKRIHGVDIKNNAWVHLVLKNLRFNVKDDNEKEDHTKIYAIFVKAYYCIVPNTDNRPYQDVIKTEPMQPAALIYLFFDNTDICYHRCLHAAVNKDIFEDGFTRLNNKIK